MKGFVMKNKNAKKHFTINFLDRKITGSKASFDKAGTGSGPIYEELMEKIARHPDFALVVNEPNNAQKKRAYKGLSKEFMKAYLSIQTDADMLSAECAEYMKLKKSNGSTEYPIMKKWFLNKFSNEESPFDMEKAQAEIDAALQKCAESNAMKMVNSDSSSKDNADNITKIGA